MSVPPAIRELGIADYEALLALWQASSLHTLRPHGRDSRAAIARQLATGVMTVLGLEVDAALVGAVLVTHDSRKGWINRLTVHPLHRRRGYGSLLVAGAERVLRDLGITVIAVLIEADNDASLSLFRSAGYAETFGGVHYLSKRETADS
jgi:ribosomal protein S18 acetylase RimI-like enzyme